MEKEKEIVCNNLTLLKYNEQKKILKNAYSQILVIFRRSVYSYDNTA